MHLKYSIAKILLSFHKEVQSLEVNITIKFFAFEWVGVDLLTLTADTEDIPEFLISKETLKIALGCTETEEVEECLQGNSLFVETWTKYFANLHVLNDLQIVQVISVLMHSAEKNVELILPYSKKNYIINNLTSYCFLHKIIFNINENHDID